MKKYTAYILATFLTGFGLLTLFLSTSVILDLFGVRAREGNYVLFIVWANFISSILYLFAAYGFFKSKKWTIKLLISSSVILITALSGLFYYINSGGIYEVKTIGAMFFRISVTLLFTGVAYFTINKKLIQK